MHTGSPRFLITGTAGGVGSATARWAVAAGYRVVLAGRDEGWSSTRSRRGGRLDVIFANARVAAGAGFVR